MSTLPPHMTRFRIRWFLLLSLAGSMVGCSASSGPEIVTIAPDQYQEAFSTTIELVRARGWEPELIDRRSGVIETAAFQSGSFVEPWHLNTLDMATIVENTLSKTRTRVRVEFRPARTASLAHSDRTTVHRPEYLGNADTADLIDTSSPLDLRVWIFTEHGHVPNVMRSTWMPTLVARPRQTGHDTTWERPPSGLVWIPTSRDRNAERRLMLAIEQSLQTNQPVQDDSATVTN
jgi:hypothetical protein